MSDKKEEQQNPEQGTAESNDPKEVFIKRIKHSLHPFGDPNSTVNVSDLLDSIVANALELKSSDIHIEPMEDKVVVRYRVDGILREVLTLEKNIEPILLFKIKIIAKIPTDEHFAPQDGRIAFIFNDRRLDTRISILPTTKGEKVVIRLLSSDGKSFALQDLGIVGDDFEVVKKSYSKPYGMILAVGPTGSGKTTTLYSILKQINTKEVNITTVEDPVEYDIDGVNHVQINTKADLTFANGLRAILRQDPDVIMIGEIRDSETAKIALNAALTGHIVLSTLHTNDAITTIPRLIDMGVENFLVASTLNIVIAQRLARRLCKECKKEYVFSEKEHADLNAIRPDIAALVKPGTKLFKEVGCKECNNSGYKGRIGLYEILEIHESIRRIISGTANVDDIFNEARKKGLVLIVEDGVNKMKEGITTVSELLRVTAIKE